MEQARQIERAMPSAAGLAGLATTVDRAAFDHSGATDVDVESAWAVSQTVNGAISEGVPQHKRLLRLANPAPLLTKDPVG